MDFDNLEMLADQPENWTLGERRPKVRVPAENGWKIARKVKRELFPYAEGIVIVGSLRRREPTIGDVELVILPKDVEDFVERVAEMGYTGGDRIRKKVVDGLTVELYLAHAPEEMGSMVQMYSGDFLMNIALRSKAKRMGLKYDQYGITKDGRIVLQSPDERDFFEYLGVEWHEPEQRSLARRSELGKMISALRSMDLSNKDRDFIEEARKRLKEDKYIPADKQLKLENLVKKYLKGTRASMGSEELVELGSLEWSPRTRFSGFKEWRAPDEEDIGGMIWYGPEGPQGHAAAEIVWDSSGYTFCEYTPAPSELEEPPGPIMRTCRSFSHDHLEYMFRESGMPVSLEKIVTNPQRYARWAASVGALELANTGGGYPVFLNELP